VDGRLPLPNLRPGRAREKSFCMAGICSQLGRDARAGFSDLFTPIMMSPKPRSRRLKKPRNYNKMRMMPGSSPLEYFERRSEWSLHQSVSCNRMKTVALCNSPVAQW
jgi:hypothetical protein